MSLDPKEAAARVLRLVAIRWGSGLEPGTIGAEVSKAARARGLSIPLDAYLETLARGHDMRATALRIAARAARGEDVEKLAAEPLEKPRRGIYMASKATHGPRWQALRAAGIPIVSTWIDESGVGETSDWPALWLRSIAEASSAAAVIVYNEPGERMRGALVEVGAALACGGTVLWVGCDSDPDGSLYTVIHHPHVLICASFDQAIDAAVAVVREGR